MKRDINHAFPYYIEQPFESAITGDDWDKGMTMRQWYKGKALEGIIQGIENIEWIVKRVSAIADAMIKEDQEFEKKGGGKYGDKEKDI